MEKRFLVGDSADALNRRFLTTSGVVVSGVHEAALFTYERAAELASDHGMIVLTAQEALVHEAHRKQRWSRGKGKRGRQR